MAAREIVSAEVPRAAQLHQKGTSFLRNELGEHGTFNGAQDI